MCENLVEHNFMGSNALLRLRWPFCKSAMEILYLLAVKQKYLNPTEFSKKHLR